MSDEYQPNDVVDSQSESEAMPTEPLMVEPDEATTAPEETTTASEEATAAEDAIVPAEPTGTSEDIPY